MVFSVTRFPVTQDCDATAIFAGSGTATTTSFDAKVWTERTASNITSPEISLNQMRRACQLSLL
jgi:hypothetical protein